MFSRARLLEAQADHAAFYLRELQALETRLNQSNSSDRLLEALESDLQQLQQAQAWSAQYAHSSEPAAQLCIGFGLTDPALLEQRQDGTAQVQWYESALQTARRWGDSSAEVRHLHHLALSYSRLGHVALERCAHLPDDPVLQAQLLNSMGDMLELMGESQQAEAYFRQSLALALDGSDERANAHWGLGNVYNTLSQPDESMQFYEQCAVVYQQRGRQTRLAMVYSRMGQLAYNQGDYARARTYQQRCIATAEPIGHLRSLTAAHRNLGYIAMDQSDPAESLGCFERSLSYAQRLGDLREHAIILGGVGQMHWRSGNTDAARAAFEQSIAYCETTGDQIGMAYMLINLSQVTQYGGDLSQASAELRQALDILERLGEPWGQAKVMMSLGELAEAQADPATADGYYRQMLALVEKIGDARGQALANVALGRTALALSQPGDATGFFRRGLSLAIEIDFPPALYNGWLVVLTWWLDSGRTTDGLALAGYLLAQPGLPDPIAAAVRERVALTGAGDVSALGERRSAADFLALLG
ncbi:MAG: tetratricopeptide repeat protein [Anaerolineae bacterium]|nr:tetratricopeptide repeat protein [Anaerolineae bacterium]